MRIIDLRAFKRGRIWIPILIIAAICAAMIYMQPGEHLARRNYNRALSVSKPVTATHEQPAATPVVALDFFTEYRMDRDRLRSERVDLLKELAQNAKSEDAPRQKAQEAIIKITVERQKELEIENLIKARGFADVIVFMRENSMNVVVKANSLNKEEVMQIADVISRSAGIKPEDITISAKL